MKEFRVALETNGLIDRDGRTKSLRSNRHQDENFTNERFDRVVANQLWLNEFGFSKNLIVGPPKRECSDLKLNGLGGGRETNCPLCLAKTRVVFILLGKYSLKILYVQ